MKTLKSIIGILVIATVFCVPKVFAIDINLFPNTNTVQPLPNESLPNISGNIDWPNVPGEASAGGSSSGGSSNTGWGQYGTNPTSGGSNTSTSSSATNSVTNGGSGTASNNTRASGNSSTGNYPSNGNNVNGGTSSSGGSFYSLLTNLFSKKSTSEQTSGQNGSGAPGTSSTSSNSNETPNNSEIDQILMNEGQIQKQQAITEKNFAWAIAFGAIILLAAALVLWKLKKNPNDVNPTN